MLRDGEHGFCAAQLPFLTVIAVHVGLVLRHTVLRREGELRRMV